MKFVFCLALACGLCLANTVHNSVSTNEIIVDNCPPGMVINPDFIFNCEHRMKRGDDGSRSTAKCIAGTLVLTNIIRQMGGGAPTPPPTPSGSRQVPADAICFVDTEGEDTTDEEAEENVNATYFLVGNRNVSFRSARVFIDIPIPQNLDEINFPFAHTQRIITQETIQLPGQIVAMRRFSATLTGYLDRINNEIERVTEMQESRMRRYIAQGIKKNNRPALIPMGFNRDFMEELFELRRQQQLITEALR